MSNPNIPADAPKKSTYDRLAPALAFAIQFTVNTILVGNAGFSAISTPPQKLESGEQTQDFWNMLANGIASPLELYRNFEYLGGRYKEINTNYEEIEDLEKKLQELQAAEAKQKAETPESATLRQRLGQAVTQAKKKIRRAYDTYQTKKAIGKEQRKIAKQILIYEAQRLIEEVRLWKNLLDNVKLAKGETIGAGITSLVVYLFLGWLANMAILGEREGLSEKIRKKLYRALKGPTASIVKGVKRT